MLAVEVSLGIAAAASGSWLVFPGAVVRILIVGPTAYFALSGRTWAHIVIATIAGLTGTVAILFGFISFSRSVEVAPIWSLISVGVAHCIWAAAAITEARRLMGSSRKA